MAKQRFVNTRFWRDQYILSLKPKARLLFLWAITNPETELCGAYQAAESSIQFETGLRPAEFKPIFDQFAADNKILYRDGWVIVMNFTRHQNGTSTNIKKAAERTLSYCPDWVKDTLSNGIDTVSVSTLPRPTPTPELKPTDVCDAGVSAKESEYVEAALAGIRSRMNINLLSKEQLWADAAVFAMVNGFTIDQFFETYDLLKKQHWRDGPITPDVMQTNLPNLEGLRNEIAKNKNGNSSKKTNSNRQRDPDSGQSSKEFLASIGNPDADLL